MQTPSSHIIQRQVFLLNAATGSATGLEWDIKANRMLKKVIMPVVESCFETLPLDGRHLIIDKLEIDLGVLLSGDFEEEARRRLQHHLSEELCACYNSAVCTKTGSSSEVAEHIAQNGITPQPPVLANAAQALYMALLHFLQSGSLPWWYTTSSSPLTDECTDQWINAISTGERDTLRQVLQQETAARTRMVHLFTPQRLSRLLDALQLNGHTALQQWEPLAQALQPFKGLLPVFHQQFWSSWISIAENSAHVPDLPQLLTKTVRGDQPLFRQFVIALLDTCKQQHHSSAFDTYTLALTACLERTQAETGTIAAIGTSTNNSDRDSINNTTSKNDLNNTSNSATVNNTGTPAAADASGHTKAEQTSTDIAANNSGPGNTNHPATANNTSTPANTDNRQTVREIMQRLTPAANSSSRINVKGDEPYWQVADAGIILLHPFLEELFTNTGLWKDQAWCTDDAPGQAIQLLSRLLNGEEGLPEYELTLSKILTGQEMDTALEATPPLPDSAFAMCDELLEAVISHWKALRSTGPAGLQEAFLLRPGKLIPVSNGYKLQVAQKAQDVLLTHLPWGFATVRLPWMKGLLYVDWN
jgi:hypothetical protein